MPFDQTGPFATSETDADLAARSARVLAPLVAQANGPTQLRVVDHDGREQTAAVPAEAFKLLVAILAEMAGGHGVRVVPHHTEMTTQEAADLLNMSRPHLVQLLDEGHIPSHKVGAHRRVLLADLMTYGADHRRARMAALDEMTQLSQELGLY